MKKMLIAVSKLSPNYENWLRRLDAESEIADLYTMAPEEAMNVAARAAGILFTGGCDIHPLHYGRPEDLPLCRETDERRDALELALVDLAFDRKIPVFGICRGQQLLNVALKGTLYADIATSVGPKIIHSAEKDVNHAVILERASAIAEISGLMAATVNSSHHQSVNILAPVLKAVAYSGDKVIEAVEAVASVHPFCMAVQWHPERMEFDHPLSGKLGKAFIEAAGRFSFASRH